MNPSQDLKKYVQDPIQQKKSTTQHPKYKYAQYLKNTKDYN